MSQVKVNINDRNYSIACDDWQEAHLGKLGTYVDQRATELKASVGNIDDSRLLVMVALLIADELSDAYADLEKKKSADRGHAQLADKEDAISIALDILAERIERIAETLEAE